LPERSAGSHPHGYLLGTLNRKFRRVLLEI
jgi:hypothetical protein